MTDPTTAVVTLKLRLTEEALGRERQRANQAEAALTSARNLCARSPLCVPDENRSTPYLPTGTPYLRPGNRNPQNVYRVDPDGSETFVAVAMSPDLAAWFVDAVNAAARENRGPEIHEEPRTDPTSTRDTRPAP